MVVSANVKEDAPTSLTKNNEAAALQMMWNKSSWSKRAKTLEDRKSVEDRKKDFRRKKKKNSGWKRAARKERRKVKENKQ
jgi:hypothetical protein